MPIRRSRRPLGRLMLVLGLSLTGPEAPAFAQEAAREALDPAALEGLVGPVALYPDDLLSIVLPAATYPIQIVEADRWIQKNKGNEDAKPQESWDDSIKALINYPDVVAKMSNELEWTAALGEAVATDQTAVMDAVQSFRRKAQGAGNLKSDDKQVVVVEKEVVKIVQADPEVIYVPQYEPQTVVVVQSAPAYPTYYPSPYPCYYYPYPPGYTFAAGFFWGAAAAYAFDWHGGGIHNDIDIDIDRNTNITNVDKRPTNIDRSKSQQMAQSKKGTWQSRQQPGDVSRGRTSQPTTRMGDRPGTGATPRAGVADRGAGASRGGAEARPTAGTTGSRAATARPTSASASRGGGAAGSGSGRYQNAGRYSGGSAGLGSGRAASAQSTRGSMSRGGGGRGGGGRRR